MGQDSPKQLGGGRTHVRYLRTHVRYHTYLPTYVHMYATYRPLNTYVFVRPSFVLRVFVRVPSSHPPISHLIYMYVPYKFKTAASDYHLCDCRLCRLLPPTSCRDARLTPYDLLCNNSSTGTIVGWTGRMASMVGAERGATPQIGVLRSVAPGAEGARSEATKYPQQATGICHSSFANRVFRLE